MEWRLAEMEYICLISIWSLDWLFLFVCFVLKNLLLVNDKMDPKKSHMYYSRVSFHMTLYGKATGKVVINPAFPRGC